MQVGGIHLDGCPGDSVNVTKPVEQKNLEALYQKHERLVKYVNQLVRHVNELDAKLDEKEQEADSADGRDAL